MSFDVCVNNSYYAQAQPKNNSHYQIIINIINIIRNFRFCVPVLVKSY